MKAEIYTTEAGLEGGKNENKALAQSNGADKQA